MEISKELIIKVMDIKYPFSDIQLNSNILSWWREDVFFEETMKINIYEFAFKCKEWAISKGYIVKSKPYDYNEDTTFSGGYFWITRIEEGHCPNCGANISEVQAIIDACNWILEMSKCQN